MRAAAVCDGAAGRQHDGRAIGPDDASVVRNCRGGEGVGKSGAADNLGDRISATAVDQLAAFSQHDRRAGAADGREIADRAGTTLIDSRATNDMGDGIGGAAVGQVRTEIDVEAVVVDALDGAEVQHRGRDLGAEIDAMTLAYDRSAGVAGAAVGHSAARQHRYAACLTEGAGGFDRAEVGKVGCGVATEVDGGPVVGQDVC